MNRFAEAIHGVKVWLQLMNIKPDGVEVVIRFRSPSDLYGAERQLARDTEPLAAQPVSFYGNYRKGTLMGMRYSLEGPGTLESPHQVAEALRRLAEDVDRPEPPRVYMDKLPKITGDVCGPFNPDDTTREG